MSLEPDAGATRARHTALAAVFFLLLTAVVSLVWSHNKLMSQDEFFVLQTDSAASVEQLIHIQRTTPISLDPLTYHLLAHASMSVFGTNALALRLPSLLGYLLMQVCLFFIVRRCFADRVIGDRAGLAALAFPALTATLFYSAEARPYGLLLGLYALIFLSWQAAIQKVSAAGLSTRERRLARTMLAVSIALALNAHYFGVLVLIPLCAGELARTIERRRIDFPVVASIVIGVAAIVFVLPFERAAAEFRHHYYNGGAVGLRAITQSYRSLFVDYTSATLRTQHVAAIAFVLCALVFILIIIYRWRRRTLYLPLPEAVFVIALAALPFFGFLLARFVTHSIEVRYVLGAIIGITVLCAVALAPALRRDGAYRAGITLLFAAILATGVARIRAEAGTTEKIRASLVLSPQQKTAILSSPSQLLYIQDIGRFEVASYYEPDLIVASHMALLYSRADEIRWDGHDTVSLTAMHMRAFTGFPIVSYDQLKQQPGPHILVLFHSGWDWTDQALAESHAQITALGPAMGGDAISVSFAPVR